MGILSMMLEAKSLHGYYPIVHMPLYSPLAMVYQVVSIFWLLLTSPLTGDIVAPYHVAQQFAGPGKVAIVTGGMLNPTITDGFVSLSFMIYARLCNNSKRRTRSQIGLVLTLSCVPFHSEYGYWL
jgi:hypothetical protein